MLNLEPHCNVMLWPIFGVIVDIRFNLDEQTIYTNLVFKSHRKNSLLPVDFNNINYFSFSGFSECVHTVTA